MRRALALGSLSLASLTMIGLSPIGTSPTLSDCANGICSMRLTAPQLLAEADRMVAQRRFDEARPMLVALANAPEFAMERHFLTGYVDAETGDLKNANKEFRAVLRERPDMTRARLELARVLLMQGRPEAADHHFRLAEQAKDLPPEIAQTIRSTRGLIREKKPWHLNFDGGIAPDSNINNATAAHTIDIPYGDGTLPFQLNNDARKRSGFGEYATVSAGVRLRLRDGVAMLLDADGSVVNQPGKDADDISALIAAGPELTMRNGARVSIQATGVQRYYGGRSATTGGGVRVAYQQNLGKGSRIGIQAETRHIESGYGRMYGGWQHSLYASYERVVRASMIASAGLFVRREDLRSAAFSSTEVGGNIGIGGELPHGINAGLSGGMSRAIFDAPYLSRDPRQDWRFNARAYIGARSLRVLGFSPSVTYTYNRIDSTLGLYKTERHRVAFGLARYF